MNLDYYFDYAATTPLGDEATRSLQNAETIFQNASSLYRSALLSKKLVEESRKKIAQSLQVLPSEIIFTSGATEANNLVLRGIADQFETPHIIISAVEHSSVRKTAEILAEQNRIELDIAPVDLNGLVHIAQLEKLIRPDTVLVSVIHTHNETGVIQHMRKISSTLSTIKDTRESDVPLYLHSDAAQSPVTQKLTAKALGVDLLTINGSKIYGPKQTGCLVKLRHVQLTPQITGGGQESGMRSGTENPALIAGFAAAFLYAQNNAKLENKRLKKIQSTFEQDLRRRGKDIEIVSSKKTRSPHITTFILPGINGESFVLLMNERHGYEIATGAACGANDDIKSSTLICMGYDIDQADGAIRISFGKNTTIEMVKKLSEAVDLAYNELKRIT